MSKRVVILAGGKGTRLQPYTVVLPKPLMPIGDCPILEVIIRQLVHQGFTDVTLAVNHQANLLKAFFGDGKKWGIHLDYSLERKPISTIAPLALIPDLPENFLLMNGDVLTDFDFSGFLERHAESHRLFTIAADRLWGPADRFFTPLDRVLRETTNGIPREHGSVCGQPASAPVCAPRLQIRI
jgi:NDP-sugar pyrophosphorylase family protein